MVLIHWAKNIAQTPEYGFVGKINYHEAIIYVASRLANKCHNKGISKKKMPNLPVGVPMFCLNPVDVGISRIPSKNADRKITDLSGKHSFTLSFSYTRCAWAGGTESQFVVRREFIRE